MIVTRRFDRSASGQSKHFSAAVCNLHDIVYRESNVSEIIAQVRLHHHPALLSAFDEATIPRAIIAHALTILLLNDLLVLNDLLARVPEANRYSQ